MTIPYCGKACAACGTYAQLSLYVQSEIATLISSSFPLFAVTEAGWEPGNKTTHQYSMLIRIILAYDHS